MSLALFEPEREVSVARIFRSPAILNCVNNVYVDSECSEQSEAIWGADPLEYHGGFHNISYNAEATFSSALTANGTVKWSLARADISNIHTGKARAKINLSFPEIDWALLQYVYGWSALQYQSWARGVLEVSEPNGQTIALFVSGLLEFSVDGKRYFGGDFYNYRRVPVILHLSQGQHIMNLRLIRDVRVLGATNEPAIEIMVEAEERRELLSVDQGSLLVSDISLGKLGNSWASIDIQNNMAEWIEVLSVNSPDVGAQIPCS